MDSPEQDGWLTLYDSAARNSSSKDTKSTSKKDMVNSPSHYNKGSIEVIDFLEDQQLGFHEGNAVKYLCRAKHKGKEIEDIKKAIWYLQRKLKKLTKIIL